MAGKLRIAALLAVLVAGAIAAFFVAHARDRDRLAAGPPAEDAAAGATTAPAELDAPPSGIGPGVPGARLELVKVTRVLGTAISAVDGAFRLPEPEGLRPRVHLVAPEGWVAEEERFVLSDEQRSGAEPLVPGWGGEFVVSTPEGPAEGASILLDGLLVAVTGPDGRAAVEANAPPRRASVQLPGFRIASGPVHPMTGELTSTEQLWYPVELEPLD